MREHDFSALEGPHAFLKGTQQRPTLVFTQRLYQEHIGPGGCNSSPVILTWCGDEWWITETGLYTYYWDDVWTTADRSRLWTVLESNCGDPGGEALILFSSDAGWTWKTLSQVEFGHYQDHYETLRMAPDGRGEMVVSWYKELSGSCRLEKDAQSEEPHRNCFGLDLFHTNDWGSTWEKPISVHGIACRIQDRDDAQTLLLTQAINGLPTRSLENLRVRFSAIPVEIDSDRLPGAISLAFDEALLSRSRIPHRWKLNLLEAADSEPDGLQFPYILDWGSEDGSHPPLLIKLPYTGYQWRAFVRGGLA
ncbi:MAG: hypothetical protein WC655_28955, partial [Candidatus Hydrogenedentales bacterium]